MDATLYEDVQRDEAATDTAEAAQNALLEARVLDLHTTLPGFVVSFDAGAQTAKVRPAIQAIFRAQGAVNLPDLVDVPVYFPSGGAFVLTFPVAAGDECLLSFSERAIDFWWQNGGGSDGLTPQLPAEYRTHDLSDAFALVGVSSKPRRISSVSTSDVELRARDGSALVSINPSGTIHLTANAGAGNVIATSGSSGMVKLNSATGSAFTEGVVTAGDPCPIIGLTLGMLGSGCARVLAGKG